MRVNGRFRICQLQPPYGLIALVWRHQQRTRRVRIRTPVEQTTRRADSFGAFFRVYIDGDLIPPPDQRPAFRSGVEVDYCGLLFPVTPKERESSARNNHMRKSSPRDFNTSFSPSYVHARTLLLRCRSERTTLTTSLSFKNNRTNK